MKMGSGNRNLLKTRRPTDLVGIDLSGEFVKLVYAKENSGEMTILEVMQRKFGEGSEKEIIQYIDGCYRALKIKKESVLLIVPSQLFITKNVDIPSKDPEEIKKIIDLQSGRFTPYSRDEIVIDYFCVETPEQHYTNVLLVIMNRKPIERYYEILDGCGIDADRILITSEGMGMTYDRATNQDSNADAIGGVHIAHDSSDFTIVDRNQLVFVRSIPIGSDHFHGDKEAAEKAFVDELNKSMAVYKDQGIGRPIKNLFLAGLVDESNTLENLMRESIPLVTLTHLPIKFLSVESCFQLGDKVKRDVQTEKQVSFFDMMACLTHSLSMKIDLVPKEIKLKHKVREGGRDVITLGIFIMTLFLMLSVFLVSKTYLKREQMKRLDELNGATVDQARVLEQISTKTRALRDLLRNRSKGLYVFEKMNSLIGDDIYLSSFSYDREGKILFSGTAVSMSRVFAFVTELEESNYFKDVQAKNTKTRREGQKEVADFEIECVIAEGV